MLHPKILGIGVETSSEPIINSSAITFAIIPLSLHTQDYGQWYEHEESVMLT